LERHGRLRAENWPGIREEAREECMSLKEMMATGLPMNRKERFFTGTVFPMIVCAEDFRYFPRLTEVIPGCPPLEVDPSPETGNVQFFTEYGLAESIYGRIANRFPEAPRSRDTPDILVYISYSEPILLAFEGKMYDNPTGAALAQQMARQRTRILDYLRPHLGVVEERVQHLALIPGRLAEALGDFGYPVLTWESVYQAFRRGREEDFWLAMLRLALASYEDLAAAPATYGRNAEARLTGLEIYEGSGTDGFGFVVMGRDQGFLGESLREDLASGRWRTQRYEVSSVDRPPNRNWFLIEDFIREIEATARSS